MSTPHHKVEEAKNKLIGRSAGWKRNGKRCKKLDVGEKGLHPCEVVVTVIVL